MGTGKLTCNAGGNPSMEQDLIQWGGGGGGGGQTRQKLQLMYGNL